MIRINLLPVRATKKKETAKQQIAIFLVAVGTVLVLGLGFYSVTLARISGTKKDIAQAETELQNLKKKIGEIDNLKKLQDDVKKKLDVLNQLRRDKTGPASRLMKLSEAMPEKLWLTKYAENGTNLSISGIALNEELIATFMRNLQATDEFGNVELQLSEQTEVGGIKMKKFDLACVLRGGKKPEAPKK